MEKVTNESEETSEKDLTIFRQPYSWLMICDGDLKNRQIFYIITDKRYHVRSISELQKCKFIVSSNKKWLIVKDNKNDPSYAVLNISTMKKIPLPATKYLFQSLHCVFSSPITDSKCRVVFFTPSMYRFWYCYLGDSELVDEDLTIEDVGEDVIEAVVNFKGKLHAFTIKYNLVTADFSDPHLVFRPIIKGTPDLRKSLPMHDEMKGYLVESSGDLLFVYTRCRDHELMDLKMYRADFVTSEWVRVENLGDRSIFLDARNSFSSMASKYGLRGNCVYFANKRGRNLFIFDMEDESISMSLPCPIAKSNSSLFWMYIGADN